jgi:NAD(P) transhydrogenase subunit beta
MMESIVNITYIVAAICFIFGIKMLGSADTARQGNRLSSLGMLLAVVVTLINEQIFSSWWLILAGLAIGAVIGGLAAQRVQMTGMPELVALFNGFGGLASLLVGWAEFDRLIGLEAVSPFTAIVIALTILIGGVTFTGSIYAWGKLSERVNGQAKLFAGQRPINLAIVVLLVGLTVGLAVVENGRFAYPIVLIIITLSLLLGILGVMPIGGGDMPVVVSLLNSLSGLAASAAGFVIANNVLIVAGSLVGASGLILTVIMTKAMNRTLANVLFSGFGATSSQQETQTQGEMKAISPEDAYYVLEAARKVVVVPGYGMAVAQAQHAVKELGELLEANGTQVSYVIHPVAGRMPGHMNVLLAEADVAYEQLAEMDDINPIMGLVDVAIIIGANDVVNPAALTDESSPIYGMPIIRSHEARAVFALKRGRGAGFSGIQNELFFYQNTRMLFGDAKATLTELVAQFKQA